MPNWFERTAIPANRARSVRQFENHLPGRFTARRKSPDADRKHPNIFPRTPPKTRQQPPDRLALRFPPRSETLSKNSVAWVLAFKSPTRGTRSITRLGPQTIYIGFRSTASSLHVGGLIRLMMLRRFSNEPACRIAWCRGATGRMIVTVARVRKRTIWLYADQLKTNVDWLRPQKRRFPRLRRRKRVHQAATGSVCLNNFRLMQGYSYLEFLR